MPLLRKRCGVTLLELIIALSISGFAILGGVMLLDQINDGGARIVTSRIANTRAGNGDRLFRRLLSDARSSIDSANRFLGDEHTASYLTLCDVPSGWSETCRATFTIDSLRDSSIVAAELNGAGHFAVRHFAGSARFRYLDLTARDSVWVHRWATSMSLPTAIAIVTSHDTLVFALGSARD